MSVKAVIFDMDGVISDTQEMHSKVESYLLKEEGINISPEEISSKFAGIVVEGFFEIIFQHYGKNADIKKIVNKKWKLLNEIAKGNVRAIPGALELISNAKTSGLKIAIASSSRIDFIHLVLKELNIEKSFDAIVSGHESQHGKPKPDIFLMAAEKLKIPASECIVIEDSHNGVLAAKTAGMKCIGFISRHSGKQDLSMADVVVDDLKKITVDMIQRM